MNETIKLAQDSVLSVDVQNALELSDLTDSESQPPSSAQLAEWATVAYIAVRDKPAEVTLRLCDITESQSLNLDYRGLDKPTNVLSFPFDSDDQAMAGAMAELELPILGDVVICHAILVGEAQQQNKSLADHYAHMVTHGILHLCGFDHQDDDSAHKMESLEATILASSQIANPYR